MTGDGTRAPTCELCDAARLTPWYHEDDVCWIAECESCAVPVVVWRQHGAEPPGPDLAHMLAALERVGTELYGDDGFRVDRVMRQIPDHFHAHARPRLRHWTPGTTAS